MKIGKNNKLFIKIIIGIALIMLIPLSVKANSSVNTTDIDRYIVTSPNGFKIDDKTIVPYGEEITVVSADDSCVVIYDGKRYFFEYKDIKESNSLTLSDCVFNSDELKVEPLYIR